MKRVSGKGKSGCSAKAKAGAQRGAWGVREVKDARFYMELAFTLREIGEALYSFS